MKTQMMLSFYCVHKNAKVESLKHAKKNHRIFFSAKLKFLVGTICTGLALTGLPVRAAPFAYVTNFGENTVSVIDITSNVSYKIAVGSSPIAIAMSPDSKHGYVVNQADNSVSVIDTTTMPNTVIDTVAVGLKPFGVAVSPDGKRVYVTNESTHSASISVIDTTKKPNVVVDTIAGPPIVGRQTSNLYGVAVSPDGNRIYVATDIILQDRISGSSTLSVSVFDTTTIPGYYLNSVTVGGCTLHYPCRDHSLSVAMKPDGKYLYSTVFSDLTTPPLGRHQITSNIQVIDTTVTPNAIVNTLSLPSNNDPVALAISPDGKRVYVANQSSNNVSVIATDTTPNTVVDTVAVGMGPAGAAVSPNGSRVYVANQSSNDLSVLDTTISPNAVVNTVAVGLSPIGVAIQQLPVNKDQCKNGDWQSFGYKNQGQCIQFVNTGK